MGRHEGDDSQEVVCSCGEKHTGHVCWLSRMGLLREVHHITCEPTVVCRQCGARANLPHNVCVPSPLGE